MRHLQNLHNSNAIGNYCGHSTSIKLVSCGKYDAVKSDPGEEPDMIDDSNQFLILFLSL